MIFDELNFDERRQKNKLETFKKRAKSEETLFLDNYNKQEKRQSV